MEAGITDFLSSISSLVFRLAAVCFVVINGAAIAAFALSRSRRLVDDWTPRLVTTNVVLATAGLGVPLVAGLARIGVHAIASLLGGASPAR